MNNGLFTVSTAIALALTASAWSPAHAQQEQQPQTQGQQQQGAPEVEVEIIRPDQEQQQVGQQQQQQQQQPTGEEIDLVTWMEAYDELGTEGWSARWILDQPVYGLDGNEVGEVENLFITPDGRISSLVVETGGFVGIGDVPIRLDVRDVQFTEDNQIVADVREENLPDFELFADEPEPEGQRAFRVTELMGDYVSLEDEPAYGYVSDIVFSPAGEVTAIIVSPSYGYGARYGTPYGYYVYPYYGYGVAQDDDEYYRLPYTTEDVGQMRPFDYGSIRREDLAEAVRGRELPVEQQQ